MAKKSPKKNKKKSSNQHHQSNKKKTTPKTQQKLKTKAQPPESKKKKLQGQEVKQAPDLFEKILEAKTLWMTLGVLLLLLLVTFGGFLFGERLFLFKDIGSDTINVFYPQLYHIADYISKEGMPLWSFHQGMGQNIYPLSINDPFNWLLYMMGAENLAYGIIWVECLKILLAGLLFYGYLKSIKLGYHTAIIGAILYSFSGFMMVGTGWYVFTTEGVHLVLLLWGFERLFQKQSWWMFTLAVFLVAFYLPVNLYLVAVFLLMYSSVRIYEDYGLQGSKFLKTYLAMIGWGALGVLMGMGMLVAMVDQIVNSPRVSGESSFFATLMAKGVGLTESREGLTILGRLFANDFFYNAAYDPNTNQLNFKGWYNYLEAPAMYCGLSTLLLLPQAFVHYTQRQRIAAAIGLGLLLLPLFVPFFRNALWLFSGNYYRMYSLFVALGLMFVGLRALDLIYKKGKVNLWLLVATFIFWMFLMFAPFLNAKGVEVDGSLRNILVILMLGSTAAIAAMQWAAYRSSARIALLVIVSLEALYMGGSTYSSERQVISKKELQEKSGYNDYTVDAVAKLQAEDPGFYRIEKMAYKSGPAIHASTNDAKIQGYMGSSSYHSFNQHNYIRFLSELDVIYPKDENDTRWASGLNPTAKGKMGTQEKQLYEQKIFPQGNNFAQCYWLQMISSHKYVLTKGGLHPAYLKKDSIGDVIIGEHPYYVPFGFTYDKVLPEANFMQLSKANEARKKHLALLQAMVVAEEDLSSFEALGTLDTNNISSNYPNEELLNQQISALRAETLALESWSQNHFKGKINVSKPKALFLSIPFDKSWRAKVDGQPVDLYRTNLGFMGLPLAAGEHSIELEFSPYYFTVSWILSLLGFLLFAGLLWWTNRKHTTTPKKEEQPLRYDGPEEEL